jgi:hypothetical protein
MSMNRRHLISAAAATPLLAAGKARAQAANTIRIGVLNDQSGTYRDLSGPGSTHAVRLAIQESGLAARGITLGVTAAATAALASEGYDPQFGARPLKRVIQQRVENGLAGKMLAGEFGDGDSVRVDYQGKSFTFTKIATAATQATG